jgi:hypothetical protein
VGRNQTDILRDLCASGFNSRVGEQATPEGATGSPLVEPDVQVSRIRLSGKQEVEGMHSSLAVTGATASQPLQPQASELGVEAKLTPSGGR